MLPHPGLLPGMMAADQGSTLRVFGLSCSHARSVFGVSTPWHTPSGEPGRCCEFMLLPGPFCLHCVPCLPDMSPAPRRFLPIARYSGRNSPGCLTEDCRVYSTDGPWGAGEPGLDGICYTFRSRDARLARLAGGPLALEPMVLSLSKDCCHHVTQCLQGSWVMLCDNPFPGETQHTCSPQRGNPQQTKYGYHQSPNW